MAFERIPDPSNDDAFHGGMLDCKYAKLVVSRINRKILIVVPPGYNKASVLESDLNIVLDLSKSLPPAPAQNPWNIRLTNDSGTLKAVVFPGYIDGNAPTIGGTAINTSPAPLLTVTATGTRYIYLKLTLTLSVSNNYVYGSDFSSAEILEGSSVPSDNKSGGIYYARLATIVDGVKQTPQPIITNLNFFTQDAGSGTSSADCKLFAM